MIAPRQISSAAGFSLVEVVVAIGLVSFSVLTTFGLLSVANDTNKKARDEGFAARLAANEFDRIRSINANFPTTYIPRYYDSNLKDLGQTKGPSAVYEFRLTFAAAPSGTADTLVNAEVRFPAGATAANQTVFRFTTLMNIPTP